MILQESGGLGQMADGQLNLSFDMYKRPGLQGLHRSLVVIQGPDRGRGTESPQNDNLDTPMFSPSTEANFNFVSNDVEMAQEPLPITGEFISQMCTG